ncbi:hypothetical protein EMIT0P260_50126 [Pseudomonas sp. IT-P260]
MRGAGFLCLRFPGVRSGAFASRLAPTFEMHSPVGASLLAKGAVQTLDILTEIACISLTR